MSEPQLSRENMATSAVISVDAMGGDAGPRAVIEGLKKCSSEYVLFQDADLEYDPHDIIMFICRSIYSKVS